MSDTASLVDAKTLAESVYEETLDENAATASAPQNSAVTLIVISETDRKAFSSPADNVLKYGGLHLATELEALSDIKVLTAPVGIRTAWDLGYLWSIQQGTVTTADGTTIDDVYFVPGSATRHGIRWAYGWGDSHVAQPDVAEGEAAALEESFPKTWIGGASSIPLTKQQFPLATRSKFHVTPWKEVLTTYEPLEAPVAFRTYSGTSSYAVAKGSIALPHGGTIHDVHHVPEFVANALSLQSLSQGKLDRATVGDKLYERYKACGSWNGIYSINGIVTFGPDTFHCISIENGLICIDVSDSVPSEKSFKQKISDLGRKIRDLKP